MPFVLNLNVMRSAWTGVDPSGDPDGKCLQLLSQIQNKCHKVVVTDEINRRYLQLWERLKQSYPHGPNLLNSMTLYLRWKQIRKVDDSRLSGQLPSVRKESAIKDEDREFARLARVTGAILVTFDEPLIRLGHELGFKAMKPCDALKLV